MSGGVHCGDVIRFAFHVTPPGEFVPHVVWFRGVVLRAVKRLKSTYAVRFEALPEDGFASVSEEDVRLSPQMEGSFGAGGWHLAEPRRAANSPALSFDTRSDRAANYPISFVASRLSTMPDEALASSQWKLRHGTAVPEASSGGGTQLLVLTSMPIALRERVAADLVTLSQGLMAALPQTPSIKFVLAGASDLMRDKRVGVQQVHAFCAALEAAFDEAIGGDVILCAPERSRHAQLARCKMANTYGATYLLRFLAATPFFDAG
jgi:hypothetical protein